MVRQRHRGRCWVCCCSLLVLLCLQIGPGLVSASLPDSNYLHLVNKHRQLRGSAESGQQGACLGESLVRQQLVGRHTVCAEVSTHQPVCKPTLQAAGWDKHAAQMPITMPPARCDVLPLSCTHHRQGGGRADTGPIHCGV